jgi:hypothetical protein
MAVVSSHIPGFYYSPPGYTTEQRVTYRRPDGHCLGFSYLTIIFHNKKVEVTTDYRPQQIIRLLSVAR